MQTFTFFAGWTRCTVEEAQQKDLANKLAVVAFICLILATYLTNRFLVNRQLRQGRKDGNILTITLLAITACILVPFLILFSLSPWC